MRRDVVGLGVVLAVGGLAYGSSRVATLPTSPVVPVASIVVALPAAAAPPPIQQILRPSPRRAGSREVLVSIARHVREAAARHGVPESLVAAVISVESEFDPRAVSRRGALGLMQLMPTTAAMLGVRDAFDPRENVDGGARHLRDLLDRFSNDVSLALAAYNAGAHAVIKHGGVPPYPETRAFVVRVLGRVGQVAMPAVAVAAAPPPASPRVRLARHTVERPHRTEGDATLLDVVLAADGTSFKTDAAPAPAPAPPASAIVARPAATAFTASVPAALVQTEAP